MYARDRGFKAVRASSLDTDILFILLHYANHLQGIAILFQTGKGAKRRCINDSGLWESHPLPALYYLDFTVSPGAIAPVHHSVNSSSHSVNGDIAIQWEWSNFDHSQNPNPLTDYDKTLHNWSAVRERLAKFVKYKASSFLFLFFSLGSPTEVFRWWIVAVAHNSSKHALWRKEVPFWGPHDGRQHFGVQIFQNRQKLPSTSTF